MKPYKFIKGSKPSKPSTKFILGCSAPKKIPFRFFKKVHVPPKIKETMPDQK